MLTNIPLADPVVLDAMAMRWRIILQVQLDA